MSDPEYVEYHVDWCGNVHTNEEVEKRNKRFSFILRIFGLMCWLITSFTLFIIAQARIETPIIILFWILFAMSAMPNIYLLYVDIRSCIDENVFCS